MYESHITVTNISEYEFLKTCQVLGTKPLIITDDSGSGQQAQLMTAKFHKNGLAESLREMHAVANSFPSVLRRKLELILGKANPPDNHLYLEFHCKYLVTKDLEQKFNKLVASLGCTTSRNKIHPQYKFATARSLINYRKLKDALSSYEFCGSIRECVVFDDNMELDTPRCVGCPLKEKYE